MVDVLREPRAREGRRRVLATLLAAARVSGLIVPDLPLEEAPELRAACEARGLALVPLVAPTTPDDRLARIGAARAGLRLRRVGHRHDGRAGRGSPWRCREIVARAAAVTDVPVAVGFGIATPEQAAAAADAGAAGVIVGSRLVRAAREAEDPAAAVRTLVAEFSVALGDAQRSP